MADTTVLICDDNDAVHESLKLYLHEAGIQTASAYDGDTVLEMFRQQKVDLIVLDLMLPKRFGIDVCREIRKNSDIPIIILSAKADETDRIVGLELGADDYVTKPFSPKEVVARIKTVLRRTRPRANAQALTLGELTIDPQSYHVFISGESVKMTPREVELLSFLVSHAGKVLSREEILNTVWGCDYYGDVRAVDTLLARIRGKVPEKRAKVAFRSIYGVGYMIEASHE